LFEVINSCSNFLKLRAHTKNHLKVVHFISKWIHVHFKRVCYLRGIYLSISYWI